MMNFTPKLIEAVARQCEPAHDHTELAIRLNTLTKIEEAIRAIRAEQVAIRQRHKQELDTLDAQLRIARKNCPHYLTTRHAGLAYDSCCRSYSTCDLCGEEIA